MSFVCMYVRTYVRMNVFKNNLTLALVMLGML